ncbi:DUF4199 domain-containing protein [Tenacibaculum agarivorans]|uniref:DUF4199 domain-containing protein n=1 Tax=Tenacibaculum agarivorans TaxID=1908389 RepID=UPI00094B7B2F|nr:DUF4199 domain-containing protein [Tenacibaculum agarivorans]
MKQTIIKYGLFSLITASVLFFLALTLGKSLPYSTQEIIGYLSMITSLSFVFLGIKYFRDKENNGKVSFGKALVIGVLISAFAGIGFGIMDYVYTTQINPNFASEYLEKSLEVMKVSLSPEEFEIKKAELTQQMQQYGGSGFMAFIMFATVVIIGFIISLLSALFLQRK